MLRKLNCSLDSVDDILHTANALNAEGFGQNVEAQIADKTLSGMFVGSIGRETYSLS